MSENSSRPLTITFNDKRELFKSYMPFIKGGAIFIPTSSENPYKMSSKVFVIMKIKDEKTQNMTTKSFSGLVVWINRVGINGGIGVAFGDTAPGVKDFIETSIVGIPNRNDLVSYTI